MIFLHGFAGSSNDWKFITHKLPKNYTPILIDLIGHGKTSSPKYKKEYFGEAQVEQLKQIIDKLLINKPILVGYSMGGRLALSFAIKYSNSIKSLVLESTFFGIANSIERQNRVTNDIELAEKIKNSTLKSFFEFWYSLPLFHSFFSLEEKELKNIKLSRELTNNKIGLQNSLLGFSTGLMPNYFQYLPEINNDILLVAGKLDKKFTNISRSADKLFPKSQLKIVDNCGHNVHLEKPEEFLKLLISFLSNL